jgi:hypothetical protein
MRVLVLVERAVYTRIDEQHRILKQHVYLSNWLTNCCEPCNGTGFNSQILRWCAPKRSYCPYLNPSQREYPTVHTGNIIGFWGKCWPILVFLDIIS